MLGGTKNKPQRIFHVFFNIKDKCVEWDQTCRANIIASQT